MKTFFLRSAVVLITAAALSSAIFAWDDTGHKLSAYIAWQTMSQDARAEAVRILLAAPEDSDLSVIYSAFGSRSKETRDLELLMYAATWPDVVRNRSFQVRYEKYHHGNWHYADIFWKDDGLVLKDFPEPTGIAVTKLAELEKTLRDPNAQDAEKAVALAWFLHLAADLHNPLHNASRVTDTEPKGDQGGNLFYLEPEKPKGEWRLNLHSYWDSIFSNMIPRENDECDTDYIRPMGVMVMNMYPFQELSSKLELSDYAAWNSDGFRFLTKSVYAGLTRDERPSAAYSRRTLNHSEMQISLAGYRIGSTLNGAFANDTGRSTARKPVQND